MHDITERVAVTESTFTIRVDDELKNAFTEAVKAKDLTGDQVIRQFMRDYIQQAREDDDCEAWFRQQVEAGRADIGAGRTSPGEEPSCMLRRNGRRPAEGPVLKDRRGPAPSA